MRRPIARAAAVAALLIVTLTNALPASGQGACVPLTRDTLRAGLEDAAVVVVGTVSEGRSAGETLVVPERYYKGTAEARSFVLRGMSHPDCPSAGVEDGARVLLVLESRDGQLAWPDASRVFLLDDGRARNAADATWELSEGDLGSRIHDLTGQDSIPVEPGGEGEQIDWMGTVVPVAGALVIVFGIGLAMMRVWHRIDPS